jgi:molecular chaperone Hsp33
MSDHLIRALALEGTARLVAVDATETVEALRRIHESAPTATVAVGRTAIGALLLAASLEKTTRREPVLTLEIDSDGPVARLVATASPQGWVRAFAAHPQADAPQLASGELDVPAIVGSTGHLAVTRDSGSGTPYRGVVELESGRLALELSRYLKDSEQTPAAAVLGVQLHPDRTVQAAGGYVLQLLPGASDDAADQLTDRVRQLSSVTNDLNRGGGPRDWLAHLAPSTLDVREEVPVRFHCGCSVDRVERALRLLGAAQIRALLSEEPGAGAELRCEFCKQAYTLSRDRLTELLLEMEGAGTRVH